MESSGAGLGYFCYDFCDVLSNRKGSDLLEIVLHHIVVSIEQPITYIYMTFSLGRVLVRKKGKLQTKESFELVDRKKNIYSRSGIAYVNRALNE